MNLVKKTQILLLLSSVFLLNLVHAEMLCSYKGPDLSDELIQLQNFEVTGTEPLEEGDKITVTFDIENFGQYDIQLGSDGIFVAGIDPDDDDFDFGNDYEKEVLYYGQSVTIETTETLDGEGTWVIWPSYHINSGSAEIYGPEEWHECELEVQAAIEDSDNDEVADNEDNCPDDYNPNQEDEDDDGIGDECDSCDDRDSDGDDIVNCMDECQGEKETYNNYEDNDGCPDTPPREPPEINISKTPENFAYCDNITIKVNAFDAKGIGKIEIWVDGSKKKDCYHVTDCMYFEECAEEDLTPGALVFTSDGFVGTSGVVGDEVEGGLDAWLTADYDNDSIINAADNCVNVSNVGQEDEDEDGVGDACDQCNLYSECTMSGAEAILTDTCYGTYDISEYESETGRHYFDSYDRVSDDGCGCGDSDGGLNYFEAGAVDKESTHATTLCVPLYGCRCNAFSDCSVEGSDFCRGSWLTEYYCDDNGIGNYSINCPYGCSEGACNCPDTDGGKEIYQQGTVAGMTDECVGSNQLREYYCGLNSSNGHIVASSEIFNCDYGCADGECVCSDSDGGVNYNISGMIGTYTDHCMDDRILVEYSTMLSSDRCYINSVNHKCDGLCSYGTCLPPTCSDGIRNQDEEDVDCGGPCTACGYVTIKGRVMYEDASSDGTTSNGFKPVRYGKFRVSICTPDYDCTSWSGVQATDSNGNFTVVLPRLDYYTNETTFKIRFGGEAAYSSGFNYAVKIARDLDYCNEYVWWDSADYPIPTNVDLNLGEMQISKDSNTDFTGYWQEYHHDLVCGGSTHDLNGGSGYFNIADAILTARQYADSYRSDDDSIGMVAIEWPDSGWSMYSSYWEEIQLYTDHGFQDGKIIHEYGHHLENEISENDIYVGDPSHTFCSDKDDTEFAWSEGFAEYFSTIVSQHNRNGTSALTGYDVGDISVETPDCRNEYGALKQGKDMESTVVAVLWDLADQNGDPTFPNSVNEAFDKVNYSEAEIFAAFDSDIGSWYDAPDLCEFIEEGYLCRKIENRFAVQDILENYNVDCDSWCKS